MRFSTLNIFCIISILLLYGCSTPFYNKKFTPSKAQASVGSLIDAYSQSIAKKEIAQQLTATYSVNGHNPIWLNPEKPARYFLEYMQHIYALQDEGIDLKQLHISAVSKAHAILTKWYKNEIILPIDSVVLLDFELTKCYITAAYLLTYGDQKKVFNGQNVSQIENFNVANNLVFSLHRSNLFPAFDGYRPQYFLYQQMMFAMKKWMQLDKDTAYMNLKSKIQTEILDTAVVYAILKKELENYSNDFEKLLLRYQGMHAIKETGILDTITLLSLQQKPYYYRQKLKVNMERLRLVSNNYPEIFLWFNTANSKFYYIQSSKVRFVSNAFASASDIYAGYVHVQNDNLFMEHQDLLIHASPDGYIYAKGQYEKRTIEDTIIIANYATLYERLLHPDFLNKKNLKYILLKGYLTIGQDIEHNTVKYLKDELGWDTYGYTF
jgi:murein L,D-transpeptidase YcbB/YkuD